MAGLGGDTPLKLAVFISGRGSNMQALIDACARDDYPAKIELVLSNKADAAGIERAQKSGLKTAIISHRDFEDRAAFEQAILDTLAGHDIDLICLAGFMRILSPHFIKNWAGMIINIHPSLLPAYKGTDTHARVLADGGKESGCSVHFVVPEVDAGEIILQRRVDVLEGDTPETLAARILEQEHIAYPEAVLKIARGEVKPPPKNAVE